METYLSFISDVGFPIVVTFYLLYRIEAKLDGVIDSIQHLPQQLFEQLKQVKYPYPSIGGIRFFCWGLLKFLYACRNI
ncbi:hypothetical protein GGR02_001964 [Anoxybacillus voinovskiensis]|uniref:YvrJ family protein n=1 Tax=Anoxybacteroides voinovskiense TaxID=230470 RepID=A0A840DXF7_9BACL|nr:hypothetical protein [Anoxybacillus voinovskiensis]GGJ68568.1 hypothetical protein GCM10008982_17480 [Anoxybacillus voinovskiensis]